MSAVAFDTNVLIYAELEKASIKGQLAIRLIGELAGHGIVAAQVLGEFLNVVRRRRPLAFGLASRQVDAYRHVLNIVPTELDIVVAAAGFSERYRLQVWDAIIWQASRKGGAAILLTEDMQDGFAADGMRALNPFSRPDWPTLAADLGLRPQP